MTEATVAQGVDATHVGRGAGSAPSRMVDALPDEALATRILRKGKLSVEETADILIPVISELAAAHQVGTVHGDLSPRNVLLPQPQHDAMPRVVGFGRATKSEEAVLRAPRGVRTYLSPEQASGSGAVGARSDQFALGLMLYECLTGQPPFEAESLDAVLAQVIDGTYRKPRHLEPTMPRVVEAIIARALRKRPEDRYASMHDFGAALLPFASKRVQRSFVAEFGPRVTSRRRGAQSAALAAEGTGRKVSRPPRAATGVWAWASARRGRVFATLAAALTAVALIVLAARSNEEAPTRGRSQAPAPEPAVATAPIASEEPAQQRTRPQRAAPRAAAGGDVPAVPERTPRTYQIDLEVAPSHAWITLDLKAAGSGRLRRALPRDGRMHELRAGAPGYKVRSVRFKDEPPPRSLVLEKKAQ